MKRKKLSALQAWKMLLLSLPKGIAAFVTVVAGLSVSVPLSVFLVGLPLLAETLVLSARMMESERWTAQAWRNGPAPNGISGAGAKPVHEGWTGWRALLGALGQGRSYRAVMYGLIQLPVSIAAFTLAVVLPVTAWAVMLSPLAYQVSKRIFSFDLYGNDEFMNWLLPAWSTYQRSWLYAGIGAVLVFLMPFILRALGRMYAAWILTVAGPQKPPAVSAANPVAPPENSSDFHMSTDRSAQPL